MPATRSINCMIPAASNGGNASSSKKPVTNCAQTKNGSRIHVMPGARNWMIVAMKLTAPSSDDVIRRIIPINQNVCPSVGIVVANGEYEVQPACAAPPGTKKLTNMTMPPSR